MSYESKKKDCALYQLVERTENSKGGDIDFITRKYEGLTVQDLRTMGMIERRNSPLFNTDPGNIKVIKVVSEKADLKSSALSEIEGCSFRDSASMFSALDRSIIQRNAKLGYTFVGGDPDSGILLFVRDPNIKLAKNGQKLAKAGMLRAGTRCTCGNPIRMVVKDFSGRDGVFVIFKGRVLQNLLESNGLPFGKTVQGSIHIANKVVMKGIMAEAVTPELRTLLGSADGVLSREDYRSIFGIEAEEGEIVIINPEDIWVMEVDTVGSGSHQRLHLGGQLIRRSPKIFSKYLLQTSHSLMAHLTRACTSQDKRDLYDYLPMWGDIVPLSDAGMRPPLKSIWKKVKNVNKVIGHEIAPIFTKAVKDTVRSIANKGFTVDGYAGRLVFDSRRSTDTGHGVPGVGIPADWRKRDGSKYKIGDLLVSLNFPILPALDADGRSTCVFTVRVEAIHVGAYFTINKNNATVAMRDEDGDKPFFMEVLPEWIEILKTMGQADINLSTKLSSSKADSVFTAELTGNVLSDSRKMLKIFLRLGGADIGKVDNRVSTAMINGVDTKIATPTDEDWSIYVSKCIQFTIESKKHACDLRYALKALDEYLRLSCPTMWDEESKYIKHPELSIGSEVQESLDELKKCSVMSAFGKFILELDGLELTEVGFVRPDYYNKIGMRLYSAIADRYVSSDVELTESKLSARRVELTEYISTLLEEAKIMLADRVIETNRNKRADNVRGWLEAEGKAAKYTLSSAEWMLVQSLMVGEKNPFFYLSFCDLDFLKLVAAIDDGVHDPDCDEHIGNLTNINKLRGSRSSKLTLVDKSGRSRALAFTKGQDITSMVSVGDMFEVKGAILEMSTGNELSVNRKKANLIDGDVLEIVQIDPVIRQDGVISTNSIWLTVS